LGKLGLDVFDCECIVFSPSSLDCSDLRLQLALALLGLSHSPFKLLVAFLELGSAVGILYLVFNLDPDLQGLETHLVLIELGSVVLQLLQCRVHQLTHIQKLVFHLGDSLQIFLRYLFLHLEHALQFNLDGTELSLLGLLGEEKLLVLPQDLGQISFYLLGALGVKTDIGLDFLLHFLVSLLGFLRLSQDTLNEALDVPQIHLTMLILIQDELEMVIDVGKGKSENLKNG
jgi:hypothetical protein